MTSMMRAPAWFFRVAWAVALAAALAAGRPARAGDDVAPPPGYAPVAELLERMIASEMAAKQLPALSIALVDDQHIVWARGFGQADPERHTPASAGTVYRVGSVSKLFTDLAVMQQVEQGALDLDAPVSQYLAEFAPRNPFGKAVTLRQLMAHRSGLVRESPVGHYFDATRPSIADTVASLNRTTLIYEPETHTKYSNAGITVVGYVLERTRNEPFAACVQRAVIDRLGLKHTGFEPTPELSDRLARGQMWTYDGRAFDPPTWPLGTAPAGNLYSTAADLGRFLAMVFAEGRTAGGGEPLLRAETLRMMQQPQLIRPGEPKGQRFGLGFMLDDLDGHRRIGHGGAVYGFATEVAALPDAKVGAVVITTRDCANAVTRRIADTALRAMLAIQRGQALPTFEPTEPVPAEQARALAGRYGNAEKGVELVERKGKLFLTPRQGGFRVELRRAGDDLVGDDRLASGPTVVPVKPGRIKVDGQTLDRAATGRPDPAPERWRGLIGEYGWDHNTLYILEKDGRLHALIEWFFLYPLEEESAGVFRFPSRGLYDGEKLIFHQDGKGRASEVEAASVRFPRRAIAGEGEATFRIKPLRPVAELRAEALAAEPPREPGEFRPPDLVELTSLDPSIRLDIRYATDNNFLGTPVYASARAFLQRPAAEALVRAHRKLQAKGYGLLIHDAYRPWHVTRMFWDATPEPDRIFVANPAQGSRHNRGAAVDLTLCDLKTGRPVPMVGGYDEFSTRSYPDYPGGTSLERWHRDLLRSVMEEQGFSVYEFEWWHFDYKDWQHYPILNIPFEQLPGVRDSKPAPAEARPAHEVKQAGAAR